MTRKNKTREGRLAQKKGVCVAVISFVEADVVPFGSVYVDLPKRSTITNILVNIIVPSSTEFAKIDIVADGSTVALNLSATTVGVNSGNLLPTSRYLETGGELIIESGSTPPANGDLVGELIVEYVELDRNIGEYTTFLDN